MTNFQDITTAQLKQILHLKERIEFLQGLLSSLRGGAALGTKKKVGRVKTMIPATKKKMGVRQQVRWAKLKGSSRG